MKRCSRCGRTQAVEAFYRHSGRRDGLSSSCKACDGDYAKSARGKASQARYNRTPKAAERKARYRARNADRVRRAETEYSRRRRARLQARIDQIKVERGCIDCGFNAHPRALDFDHRGDAPKLANISKILRATVRWELIRAEIDKCDVRCANCHRIRTAEGNHYRNVNTHKVRQR